MFAVKHYSPMLAMRMSAVPPRTVRLLGIDASIVFMLKEQSLFSFRIKLLMLKVKIILFPHLMASE